MGSPYSTLETVGLGLRYLVPSLGRRPWTGRLTDMPASPPSGCARIVVAGDLMASKRWQVPRVHPTIRQVISGADLFIANCEGPVRRDTTVSRLGRERPTVGFLTALLQELGAAPERTVLSVANNHCLDHGAGDVFTTVANLRSMGITPVGQRTDGPLQHGIATVACGDTRLTVVAWTEWMNSKNSAPPVWHEPPPSAHWSADGSRDLVVLYPHWGHELELAPRPPQRVRAERLLGEHNAVMVGHHPHVVQPMERIGRSLCLYSIGNLLGPPIPLRWTMRLGLLLELWLDSGNVAGFAVHPVVQLPGPRLVPLASAPRRLRRRLSGLLNWLDAATDSAASPSPNAQAAAHR